MGCRRPLDHTMNAGLQTWRVYWEAQKSLLPKLLPEHISIVYHAYLTISLNFSLNLIVLVHIYKLLIGLIAADTY
jgi:hypothetical protein